MTRTRRFCAVSVDLDGIAHYRAIHGLPPASPEGARLVYGVALARALELADALAIPLTFFAIGDDLADPVAAEALVLASARGHAIENHSLSHRYDLSRLSLEAIAAEIRGGADAIAAAVGRRPRGFRAPGYLVGDRLFAALRAEEVAWDSSVFPCPAYYLAKLAALARVAARGGASAAIVGDPRVLAAPRQPYQPGRRWYEAGGTDLVELPIAVTRRARLPMIGTAIAWAGAAGARRLARGCAGDAVVSLELHAIDFLDRGDGLVDLARAQPDLRLSVARKVGAFGAAIDALRVAGRRFATVDEVASDVRERSADHPDGWAPSH